MSHFFLILTLAGPPNSTSELELPRALEAAGKRIEALLGHAGPALTDWDGDGDLDLLVGQFGEGLLAIHTNEGSRANPRLAAGRWFEAGNELGRIPTGGDVGFGPQVADLDGDGFADVLTGHAWPGDVHWFRGRADGGFEPYEHPLDESGRALNAGLPWSSPDVPRPESLASAIFLTDFDGDGDLDALFGNSEGSVVLVENIGGPRAPRFSLGRRKLQAAGETIRTPLGDSGPVHADWDGDGHRDLVVGAGDGSVRWYPNLGDEAEPRFGAGRLLVTADERFLTPLPHGTVTTRSALRAKPAVADWNGDGRVDLLVGDVWTERGRQPDLTPDDVVRRAELLAEHAALEAEAIELYDQGGEPDAAATESLTERFSAIFVELQSFEAQPTMRGHVWLYARAE